MATAKWCHKQVRFSEPHRSRFVRNDRILTLSGSIVRYAIVPLNYSSQSKSIGARSKTTYRAARRNAEREARRKNRR